MLLKYGPGRITPARTYRACEDGTALPVDVRETDACEAGHAHGAAGSVI